MGKRLGNEEDYIFSSLILLYESITFKIIKPIKILILFKLLMKKIYL